MGWFTDGGYPARGVLGGIVAQGFVANAPAASRAGILIAIAGARDTVNGRGGVLVHEHHPVGGAGRQVGGGRGGPEPVVVQGGVSSCNPADPLELEELRARCSAAVRIKRRFDGADSLHCMQANTHIIELVARRVGTGGERRRPPFVVA